MMIFITYKTYRMMQRGSIIGLGLAFVYYGFIIDDYPDYKNIMDILKIVSFLVFIGSILMKVLKKVR